MIEVYFGKNKGRNHHLIAFFQYYDIDYKTVSLEDLTQSDLLSLCSKTPDCFELLSSPFLRFKRQGQVKLTTLLDLVLEAPDKHLRLPLVVCRDKVYSDVTLEEARTFIPRRYKTTDFQMKRLNDMVGIR